MSQGASPSKNSTWAMPSLLYTLAGSGVVFEISSVTKPSHSGSKGVTFTISPQRAYDDLPRQIVSTPRGMRKYSTVRASNFDSFLPLGPAIATHVDPTELVIGCSVNGVTRQMTTTHDMLFTVAQVIAFASAAMTLYAGDLILMGSPAGGTPLNDRDVVEVHIEGIGALRNPVVRES